MEDLEKTLEDGTEEKVEIIQNGITDLGQKMLIEMQETDDIRTGLDDMRERMAALRAKFKTDLGIESGKQEPEDAVEE